MMAASGEDLNNAPPAGQAGPRIRRRRKLVSCDYCRSRKLKCDKNQPCLSCIKKNNSNCVYASDDSATNPSNQVLGGINKNTTGQSYRHKVPSSMSSSTFISDPEVSEMDFLLPNIERSSATFPEEVSSNAAANPVTPGTTRPSPGFMSDAMAGNFGLEPALNNDSSSGGGDDLFSVDDLIGASRSRTDIPLQKRLDRMERILLSLAINQQNNQKTTGRSLSSSSSFSRNSHSNHAQLDNTEVQSVTGSTSIIGDSSGFSGFSGFSTVPPQQQTASAPPNYGTDDTGEQNVLDPVEQLRESLGMLKLDQKGKSLYHGDTHWISLFHDLSEVQEFFKNMRDLTGSMRQQRGFCDYVSTNPSFFGPFRGSKYSGKEILDSIPNDEDCDVLIQRYFKCIGPVYNVVNEPWFNQRLQEFRNNPNDVEILWVALLLCVLVLAVWSYPDNEQPAIIQGYLNNNLQIWLEGVESCCELGKITTKPSVLNLRVLLLWQFVQAGKGEWPDVSWYNSGLLVRVAQSMGLYRDPRYFTLPPFEVEERRRAWAYVQYLDSYNSIREGLPLGINPEEQDVKFPGNYVSEDLIWNFGHAPVPRNRSVYTSSSYLIASLELLNLRNTAYSANLNITKPVLTYKELWKLDAEIRSFYKNLPRHLRRKCDESVPNDPPELVIQRFLLEVDFQKTLIVLHRAYSQRVKDKEMFISSRNVSREASLRILELHHWLICTPSNKELLHRFNWAISTFTMPYVVHAIIALSVAVINKDKVDPAIGQSLTHHAKLTQELLKHCGDKDSTVKINFLLHQLSIAVLTHALKVDTFSDVEERRAQKNKIGKLGYDDDTSSSDNGVPLADFNTGAARPRTSISERISLSSRADKALVLGLDGSDVDLMVDTLVRSQNRQGSSSSFATWNAVSSESETASSSHSNNARGQGNGMSPDSLNTSASRSTASEVSPGLNMLGTQDPSSKVPEREHGMVASPPDGIKAQMIYDLTKQLSEGDNSIDVNEMMASVEWDNFMVNIDEELAGERGM